MPDIATFILFFFAPKKIKTKQTKQYCDVHESDTNTELHNHGQQVFQNAPVSLFTLLEHFTPSLAFCFFFYIPDSEKNPFNNSEVKHVLSGKRSSKKPEAFSMLKYNRAYATNQNL